MQIKTIEKNIKTKLKSAIINSIVSIETKPEKLKGGKSKAAKWHSERRREMIKRHGDAITSLETQSSAHITLPLLVLSNTGLSVLSVYSASLSPIPFLCLTFGIGSILSLWQLQILHEVLHGSMFSSHELNKRYGDVLLYWGSMPSAFGYWLYLKYGHLSHHSTFGQDSLLQVFESSAKNLGDGDLLFVNHRMKLKGEIGPTIPIPFSKGKKLTVSIGAMTFGNWIKDQYVLNSMLFSFSFLFERVMLVMNDFIVALTGQNFFFPNKSQEFQNQTATYTRIAVSLRLLLCLLGGIFFSSDDALFSVKPLLFLMLSETLWSLPPHPASAMFITNHGSNFFTNKKNEQIACKPTSSTYAGTWYSILTLGTNYHTEHHDFPLIPLHLLGKVRHIVGEEFYNVQDDDNVFDIMKQTFASPQFYACSNDVSSIGHEFISENS